VFTDGIMENGIQERIDIVVAAIARHEGDCSGQRLLDVVRQCVYSCGCAWQGPCGGSCAVASGRLLEGIGGCTGGDEVLVAACREAGCGQDVGDDAGGARGVGRVDVGIGGTSWRSAPVRGPVTVPRGPNFLRNHEARLRKKIAKEEEKKENGKPVVKGFFSDCTSEVQVKLRESRAKLLIAENERKLVEEQRKLKYLNSPMAAVSEAMRAVEIAERLAKKENNSKVVGWAKTVVDSYASSISGTGSERNSLGSVSVNSSVSQVGVKVLGRSASDSVGSSVSGNSEIREYFSLKNKPASAAEREVLANGVLGISALITARVKVRRVLNAADFLRADFKLPLDRNTQFLLQTMEE